MKLSAILSRSGVQRVLANSCPGYPCRVSLQDAKVGESVLLMNYEHQPAATPFRSSHAIYVREWASRAKPLENEIPGFLRKRVLSVRAFDDSWLSRPKSPIASSTMRFASVSASS